MIPTILIIEDNRSDIVLLQESLAEHRVEYTATVITDGDDAYETVVNWPAGRTQPCLVILDLNLPKRDGIEILKAIRGSDHMNDVPVVILTTSDSPAEQEMAQSLGVRAYLRKPVDLDGFLALGSTLKVLCEQSSPA